MLNLANLRVLIAVAETGGVRQAAKRLNRTPSAISMSLKQLEESVGSPLFEGDRKVRPTKFGAFTIDSARDIVRHFDNSCASILAYSRDSVGRCTVASVTSFAATVLPDAIRLAKDRSKLFEVVLRETHSSKMLDAVADGLVDVGFGRIGAVHPDVIASPLIDEKYNLVCHASHPLAQSSVPIEWDQIAEDSFISFDEYRGHDCVELASRAENARYSVSSAPFAFALVSADIGVAVVPEMASKVAPNDVKFLPLADPTASRTLGVLTKRDRKLSNASALLIDTCRELLEKRAQ